MHFNEIQFDGVKPISNNDVYDLYVCIDLFSLNQYQHIHAYVFMLIMISKFLQIIDPSNM